MEFLVIASIVIIGSALLLRRWSDPSRLERQRLENLRKIAEHQDQEQEEQ